LLSTLWDLSSTLQRLICCCVQYSMFEQLFSYYYYFSSFSFGASAAFRAIAYPLLGVRKNEFLRSNAVSLTPKPYMEHRGTSVCPVSASKPLRHRWRHQQLGCGRYCVWVALVHANFLLAKYAFVKVENHRRREKLFNGG
jgi:hypothetical protein